MPTDFLKQRRFPIGAEVIGSGVHFRLWAPRRKKVEVIIVDPAGDTSYGLNYENGGYFSGFVPSVEAGALYSFRFDNQHGPFPDPASRFQPHGPHGPSEVIDPLKFQWTDQTWKGSPDSGQVIYEMHFGTFTKEGTFSAAIEELKELASIGITTLEIMPVAEFPGTFGWGYDGVDLFAPYHLYGSPDDLRSFINAAHAEGLAVILDVVYNHFGPDGNYMKEFSLDYFTDRYKNEWGESINFDGKNSSHVREFFLTNAEYWISEFHLDGLRLDATQQIFDSSAEHILSLISLTVRQAAKEKNTFIVAENEPQHIKLVHPINQGGFGLDALWNDDLHHSSFVALTGHNEAYYTDYKGAPQEFISSFKYGYLFQGQYYVWQKQKRGTPAIGLDPKVFVTFIQNHDQIANSGRGERIHQMTSPGNFKAMTALFLLSPGTPMLFQGEEFASSSPFFYFADHNEELARLVSKGRAEFLAQFPSLATKEMQACLPTPALRTTFEKSILDFSERKKHKYLYSLHKDLLSLRKNDGLINRLKPGNIDGAVLSDKTFLLRFFSPDKKDRLLLVNFGIDLSLSPAPEPLLAPPEGMQWKLIFSTEDVRYGGCGTVIPALNSIWRLQGNAAIFLKADYHKEGKNE